MQERVDLWLERFNRAGIAGVVYALPIVVAVAVGLPRWVSFAYLIVATPLYATVIFRGWPRWGRWLRRRSSGT